MVSQPQIARLLQRQAAAADGDFAGDVIFLNHLCCACLVTQSRPTLCNSMDCSPPGSSVHGILQARILEWVANPFSRESSQLRDQTRVSCIAGRYCTTEILGMVTSGVGFSLLTIKNVKAELPWWSSG